MCNDESTYMKIDNSNISLRKFNNFYKVLNNLNYQQLDVHLAKYEPVLDHNELLVNGVDYLKQMVGINKVVEINGFYNVIKPIMPILDNEPHFSLASLVEKIVIYGIGILLVIIIVVVLYQIIKFIIRFNNKSKKNKQYNDLKKCVAYIKKQNESSELQTDTIELV